jgi:predicted transcriptional regulator of viral defense system
MAMSLLLKKLRIDGKEFMRADEIRKYCETMDLDYTATIKYLSSRSHLVRIFRGVFYVRTLDEEGLGKTLYTPLELVMKGLELKDVKNWYFGLNTALKLNNMTHEYYAVDYVVNDMLFRAKPISIAGLKFRFMKLAPSLFGFGVKTDGIRFSDPEKTVLDFVYTWRYNGVPRERILLSLREWSGMLSKTILREYSENYPKTVRSIAEVVV